MKFIKTLVVASLITFSLNASAEDHPLGTAKGMDGQIDLKVFDHAVAGSVRDFVMWGVLDEGTGISEMLMRRDGQVVKTSFQRQTDGHTGGVIRQKIESVDHDTGIYFVKLDRPTSTFHLTINDKPFSVKVDAESFSNNHFINPTYTATMEDGKQISFQLEGQACYGYSLHLIFMIFGAYLH